MSTPSITIASDTCKNKFNRILIIGGRGSIGSALVQHYSQYKGSELFTLSRPNSTALKPSVHNKNKSLSSLTEFYVDYFDDQSMQQVVSNITISGKLDLIILATGFLQNETIKPEKSINDLSLKNLEYIFAVNTFLPAMMIRYFLPHLNPNIPAVFAALSARVGSISDNRLGGWYSYRASKSALNMLIKTASIELKRVNNNGIIVGLHPGTVKSQLSEPFLKNQPQHKIFSPDHSAQCLSEVINQLTQNESGKCIDWNGSEIFP
ncbi:SDR family NAD(P)-dependent oxidoreductase [Thorsellia kenyensis]|uniref:SDR family NAD(P)-dependent oxidoreductase n=1 Tax=Thorsellia kenyensis TaxID=1549888 RepID=A0ABV6CC13_9GAMM